MRTLGFIGIDQYGTHYHIKKHPRKELMEQLGSRSASKMYLDAKEGKCKHVGYVIKRCWISVYRICQWKGGELKCNQ